MDNTKRISTCLEISGFTLNAEKKNRDKLLEKRTQIFTDLTVYPLPAPLRPDTSGKPRGNLGADFIDFKRFTKTLCSSRILAYASTLKFIMRILLIIKCLK